MKFGLLIFYIVFLATNNLKGIRLDPHVESSNLRCLPVWKEAGVALEG